MNGDTIFAVSSGAGMAGVAVIRVSGRASLDTASRLCGPLPPARKASLRQIRNLAGELIDEGLLIVFPGPNSFTGEDVCEFHVHGGVAVQTALIGALSGLPGLRPAEAGEFTRRAMRNRKLDLMEVEGLSDLIRARTERQRRQALRHAGGEASREAEAWRRDLIEISARVAAAIDFADEPGVAEEALRDIRRPIALLISSLEKALRDVSRGEAVREGLNVVLAGPPNAGKSSILNRLAKRDAAIVSPVPGTTRDAIEVMVEFAGVPVTLTDTAGLRDHPENEIEAAGMERTRHAGRTADLIIWVTARGEPGEPPTFDSEVLRLENKSDLPGAPSEGPLYRVSAKTGQGMAAFIEGLEGRLKNAVVTAEAPILIRARHAVAAKECAEALKAALDSGPQQIEVMAEELRRASDALGRLTGRIDVEDVLDRIFREFCIGK